MATAKFDSKCRRVICAIIFQLVTVKEKNGGTDNTEPLNVGMIIHSGFVSYVMISKE